MRPKRDRAQVRRAVLDDDIRLVGDTVSQKHWAKLADGNVPGDTIDKTTNVCISIYEIGTSSTCGMEREGRVIEMKHRLTHLMGAGPVRLRCGLSSSVCKGAWVGRREAMVGERKLLKDTSLGNKDIKKTTRGGMGGRTMNSVKVKVLRGGLLVVHDVFVIRRVVIWYFSLPVALLRDGFGEGLQSVLENSACERLRTKTVWVRPSGQSRSLQGFLGVAVGLGIEANGRSGREVGKCGFVRVGGTIDLGAPRARGEETEGREYIMTGGWRRDVSRGRGGETDSDLQSGEEGWEELSKKTSFERIYKRTVEMDAPKELEAREPIFCWGSLST